MAWELYDKTKFVDYLGSTYNLKLLMDLKNSAVNQFLNAGNTEQGADAQTVQNMIQELRPLPDWDWLVDILGKAEPPVRIADGTEEWLRETYPNEEWEEPISSVDDPRIPDYSRNMMNVLTANIQREWLARIVAGSKKIEYRDATAILVEASL